LEGGTEKEIGSKKRRDYEKNRSRYRTSAKSSPRKGGTLSLISGKGRGILVKKTSLKKTDIQHIRGPRKVHRRGEASRQRGLYEREKKLCMKKKFQGDETVAGERRKRDQSKKKKQGDLQGGVKGCGGKRRQAIPISREGGIIEQPRGNIPRGQALKE